MTAESSKSFVNQLITNQRNAIRYHVAFAVAIVLIGVAVVTAAFLLPSDLMADGIKTILSIGGGLVSSLSGFQLKEILQRREKITVFETVKIRLDGPIDQAERTRIEELLWKLVEKTAIGS